MIAPTSSTTIVPQRQLGHGEEGDRNHGGLSIRKTTYSYAELVLPAQGIARNGTTWHFFTKLGVAVIVLPPGPNYKPSPVHRNRTPGKSQWTISVKQERTAFVNAFGSSWLLEQVGWGLHTPNGKPDYLGVARDHIRRVFVAKFVDRGATNIWHGYPADHQRSCTDIPDESILQSWLRLGLLGAPKIRKLSKGQPCSL